MYFFLRKSIKFGNCLLDVVLMHSRSSQLQKAAQKKQRCSAIRAWFSCVCVYIFRRSKKKKDVACRGIFGAALWNQRALVTDVDLEKYYVR